MNVDISYSIDEQTHPYPQHAAGKAVFVNVALLADELTPISIAPLGSERLGWIELRFRGSENHVYNTTH